MAEKSFDFAVGTLLKSVVDAILPSGKSAAGKRPMIRSTLCCQNPLLDANFPDKAKLFTITKNTPEVFSGVLERLAATYSRGSYTTTTIGHAVFDGRVRNGNGSDHCGSATKIGEHGLDVQN